MLGKEKSRQLSEYETVYLQTREDFPVALKSGLSLELQQKASSIAPSRSSHQFVIECKGSPVQATRDPIELVIRTCQSSPGRQL